LRHRKREFHFFAFPFFSSFRGPGLSLPTYERPVTQNLGHSHPRSCGLGFIITRIFFAAPSARWTESARQTREIKPASPDYFAARSIFLTALLRDSFGDIAIDRPIDERTPEISDLVSRLLLFTERLVSFAQDRGLRPIRTLHIENLLFFLKNIAFF